MKIIIINECYNGVSVEKLHTWECKFCIPSVS
jgi:hypothetical protein